MQTFFIIVKYSTLSKISSAVCYDVGSCLLFQSTNFYELKSKNKMPFALTKALKQTSRNINSVKTLQC